MQRMGRDCPELLHGARRIDADELEVHANMAVACLASSTGSARIQGTHGDSVARLPCPCVGANRLYRAGDFMADDLGQFNPMVHSSVKDVEVCPADTAVGYANLHLTPVWRNRRTRSGRHVLVTLVECCFHESSIVSNGFARRTC